MGHGMLNSQQNACLEYRKTWVLCPILHKQDSVLHAYRQKDQNFKQHLQPGPGIIPQTSMHMSWQKRADFPGVLSLLGLQVSFPISLQYFFSQQLARGTQSAGKLEQLAQDPQTLHLHTGAGTIPQRNIQRSDQKIAGLQKC